MIIISSSIKLFLSSTYFYIFMICEKYTRVRYFLTSVYYLSEVKIMMVWIEFSIISPFP